MQSKKWHEEIIANIGRAVENARDGKSDRWISERTEKLGNPLSRTAVSEYRRGVRKTISIADWLTLAAALGVPPVSLLLPELPDGRINLLPAVGDVNQLDAFMWIVGERQTIPDGFNPVFSMETGSEMAEVKGRREYRSSLDWTQGSFDIRSEEEPSREKLLLDVVRELRAVLVEIQSIRTPFEVFEHLGDDAAKRQAINLYVNQLQEKRAELEKLEDRIIKLDGVIQEEHIVEYDQDGDR